MMDDIPSFGDAEYDSTVDESAEPDTSDLKPIAEQDENDYDDSILNDAFDDVDSFALEQEVDGEAPNEQAEHQLQEESKQQNQEHSSHSLNSEKSDDDIKEPGDVPGLDDWLSGESSDDIEDEEIFDELDSAEFDELLESLEADTPADSTSSKDNEQTGDAPQELQGELDSESTQNDVDNNDESAVEPESSEESAEEEFALEDDDTFELDDDAFDIEGDAFELEDDDSELDDLTLPDVDESSLNESLQDDGSQNDSAESEFDAPFEQTPEQESKEEFKLDNPDLDLEALLNDMPSVEMGGDSNDVEDFLDVEALMDDGDDSTFNDPDSQPLDLDVSLSDFTGITDTDSVIDIDKDAGQNANLDLARAYLEMEDVDAAKELLEEVMRDGSEEQRQEAGTILKSID